MENDFREHPDRVMYSEYPDALVKRGLAKAVIMKPSDWRGDIVSICQLSDCQHKLYVHDMKDTQ